MKLSLGDAPVEQRLGKPQPWEAACTMASQAGGNQTSNLPGASLAFVSRLRGEQRYLQQGKITPI